MELAEVAVGGFHFLARFDNGDLYGWGSNSFGQVGDGTKEDRHQPVFVLREVVHVCAGWYHSMAILQTGETVAWGRNNCGQLGDGTKQDRASPAPVQSPLGAGKAKLMHAEVLAAGQDHSLAILHPPGLEKSVLYGWGGNVGKPEDCFTNVSPNVVIPEALIDDIMQVAAGRTHSLALRSTGELFTWGRNTFGQLGDCSILGKTQPTKVMNLVRQVAAGVDFSLAVLESGTVMAFGCNAGGRLGNGDARHQQAPTPILEGVRSVTAGHSHCFALLENGQCLGWGANQHGCIRQSGEPAVLTPVIVEVADMLSIKEIKAGSSATLALLSSGEYAVWGRNWQRQISCLTELGATVQLNWRPSDPVQGEVAVDAIADASTYDVKSLMASTAALKQGKTPRSAAEVAAAFAGRSAAEAAMLRSEARAKAAEAAGKAAFNAARTAGMTVPVSAHLAAVAAAQAARGTAEDATTCDEGLPPFAAECAFLAGQAAGLGPLEAAEEAAAGAAKAAFKPPEEKPGPGDASAAMRAAKAAAVAFGVAGERANWIAAVSAGRLVGEAMIFEGQHPYQMAKLASAARSQLAIAEAERGMQRLEDAALEAGRAAHRLAVELGMGEDGALDATAVCASQLAEDFAAAAWKSLEQVAAWAGRAAYGALSHTGATEELMADLAAMCAGRAAAEFLVEEGRRVEEAPTAAGLAASRASEACGSYAVAPKVQRAGKAAGAAAQLLGLSPAECATCAARAAALCASEGRVRAELLAKMAGMAAGNAALAVGLELAQAAEAAQRSAETEGYDAGLTADVAERAGRLAYDKVLGIIHDSDSEEEHEEEVKEETVVEESEPEEVFQGFQSLEEADAAFEAWMFTACERYGKSIHKKVHAKAKNLGRAYALVWQAYRKSHGHQSRMSDLDKDDHALMAFHAKLYKDAISFLHADRIPGGAEQFGWPPEAVSIHTGTAAVHAAITQAAKATTNDQNENLFAGPPPVLNAQLAKLAGKEDLQVLHGPGMSETLRWPQEKPRRHRSRSARSDNSGSDGKGRSPDGRAG